MAQNAAQSAPNSAPSTFTDVLSASSHHERVLIIDFGSQVTQLIARRVRESGVYCEIHPYNKVDSGFLKAFAPKAIIFSGGPASVTEGQSPRAPEDAPHLVPENRGIVVGVSVHPERMRGLAHQILVASMP